MKSIRIRRFEPSDMRQLLRLETEAFRDDAWDRDFLAAYERRRDGVFLVAIIGARLAGYCIARQYGTNAADIDSIAVLSSFRRCGVARTLLRTALGRLRRRGIDTVGLMVRRDNCAAIAFYKSFGFVRRRTVPDYYEDGESAWRMAMRVPLRIAAAATR